MTGLLVLAAAAVPAESSVQPGPSHLTDPATYEELREAQAKFEADANTVLIDSLSAAIDDVQALMQLDSSPDMQAAEAQLERALAEANQLRDSDAPPSLSQMPKPPFLVMEPADLPENSTDLNCDGVTNGIDALIALRHSVSLTPLPAVSPCFAIGAVFLQVIFGDTDCDQVVDEGDALPVLRVGAGIDDELVCPAIAASTPSDAQPAGDSIASGYLFCIDEGVQFPLGHAVVQLWDDWSGFHLADDMVAQGVTDANGHFSITFNGPADIYARFVLQDRPVVTNVGVVVRNLLGTYFADMTTEVTDAMGNVDLGEWSFGSDPEPGAGGTPCGVFAGAQAAYEDYAHQRLFEAERVPPYGRYTVQLGGAITFGAPWTNLDTTHWPPGSGVGWRSRAGVPHVSLHEFAHTVRHSFDAEGDGAHWLGDAIRFWFARSHSCIDKTNEGFAFNEGWAEYWANTGCLTSDPADKEVEGNVANALIALSTCLDNARHGDASLPGGHEILLGVLEWASKGSIETYNNLVSALPNYLASKGAAYAQYADECLDVSFVQVPVNNDGNSDAGEEHLISLDDIEEHVDLENR